MVADCLGSADLASEAPLDSKYDRRGHNRRIYRMQAVSDVSGHAWSWNCCTAVSFKTSNVLDWDIPSQ